MKTGPVATYKGSESVRDVNVSQGHMLVCIPVCVCVCAYVMCDHPKRCVVCTYAFLKSFSTYTVVRLPDPTYLHLIIGSVPSCSQPTCRYTLPHSRFPQPYDSDTRGMQRRAVSSATLVPLIRMLNHFNGYVQCLDAGVYCGKCKLQMWFHF